jgi:arsenate reductase
VKRLLFVCIENSNRSQMAEAFARIRGGDAVEAFSAGSRPSGRVNPKAVAAMSELDYDLTTHASSGLGDLPDVDFAAAVTMGCGDACPNVKAAHREDWDIPDPALLDGSEFNAVRDLIEDRVRSLLESLGVEAS